MNAAAAALSPREPDVRASLRVVAYLTASWLLLLVVGFLTLRTGDALGASNKVSFDRAVFLSANVGTLSGFSLDFAKADDFAAPVRAVFVMQTLSGALLALAGGGILWARLLGRRHSDAQLTAVALLLIAFSAAIGCATVRVGEPVANAAVRGLSAIGNGGVLFGDWPKPADLSFNLFLVPLSVLGSLGVVVLTDAYARLIGRPVSIGHASRVLTLASGVFVVGLLWIAVCLRADGASWPAALVRANALVWTARGWGLPIDFASNWPSGVLAAVLAVALVGAGSAGSTGVIGLGWLATAPRRLQPMIVNALFAQAVLASASLAAVAWLDNTLVPARRLLVVVSAAMNLGLSHEPLSVTRGTLLVLSVTMVAAKLLPLGVFAIALRPKGNA